MQNEEKSEPIGVIKMDELEIYKRMNEIGASPQFSMVFSEDTEQARKIMMHKEWLSTIRHERPRTDFPFCVGIYIRYFNQTRYDNYLEYHKKRFADTIALCPQWSLVDFYIDEGSTAPNMETAPGWTQLLDDCLSGKVNLIITQKISNISKRISEVTFCSRLLAAQNPPVGIYFVSEDIYTMASYYQQDLHDPFFLPSPDWKILPDDAMNESRWIND